MESRYYIEKLKNLGDDRGGLNVIEGETQVPFEIKRANANPYEALTEHEILDKLEKSREHAAQGMCKDATEVSRDMRAKYGL